jgi:hypothetical protein
MKRGQYYRLLLATTANPTTVIAAAKDAQIHFGTQVEESSTKDTTGDALEYEIVGQSYDISGSALVLTPADSLNTGAVSLNDMETNVGDTKLYWRICLMSGDNQRTVEEELLSGTAKLTQLTANAQVKQTATYQYTLTGYDGVTVHTSTT